MFAQINHAAIISHQYPLLQKFYEAVFNMKGSSFRVTDAPIVADGYVGMQIIPRRDGYVGGLDHFGLKVTGIDAIVADLKKKGAEFTMEPNDIRPGVRIAFLRGPEGVSIELLERK